MLTKLIRSTKKQIILLHLFVVFLILFVLLAMPVLADQGGPDNFGYVYVDSDEAGGSCNPTFTDISATGTALNLTDDQRTNVTMPFSFTFYGVSSNGLRVGNNGGILFGTTTGGLQGLNQALPAAALAFPAILPFWDDLGATAGNVFVQSLGAAPNRRYIVQWHDRPDFDVGGNVTLQAVLYEGTTNIDFIYQDVIFGDVSADNGVSATVGLHQNSGNALQYSFNTAALTDGLAICFRLQQAEIAVLDGGTEIPNNTGSVNFGATAIGTAVTKTFTISSSGLTDLNLTGSPLVTITGPAALDFSLAVSPTTPISPNNTTTFQVRFDPSLAGTRAATLTIANDDPDENPYTFAVQGEGLGVPAITLEKTVGPDPDVCAPTNDLTLPGGGDVTYCFRVRNTGSLTLTLHNFEDDQLGILLNNFPYSLGPGATAFLTGTTTVTQTIINTAIWTAFNPGPTDVVTATASATVTVPVSVPDITVSGNGQAIANGDISPSTADGTDFGSITLGQALTQTFTISNTGEADLNLTGSPLVTITGAAASDFNLVASPVTPITSGSATTFQVRFTPGVAGVRAASLTIASNDPDETPYTFAIQGTGVSEVGDNFIYLPIISKESIPVTDLVVDSLAASSGAITVTIRNAGTAAVVDAFWVDVYFNPSQTPGLNEPWDTIASAGIAWGVTETLDPGETLTLTVGGPYYFASESSPPPFPAGAQVFALVDSINLDTTYGNVLEGEEANNLFGPVTLVATKDAGEKPNLQIGSPLQEGLPER